MKIWVACHRIPSGNVFPSHLKKDGLGFQVTKQRAEMARGSGLLLINSLGNPGKRKVSACNLQFLRIAHYGKKHAVLVFQI
jgi:hypothetical protein